MPSHLYANANHVRSCRQPNLRIFYLTKRFPSLYVREHQTKFINFERKCFLSVDMEGKKASKRQWKCLIFFPIGDRKGRSCPQVVQQAQLLSAKKVISFPFFRSFRVNLSGKMDKVSLTSESSRRAGKYTYANLMTQAGHKNCQPLWLFKTFTGTTKNILRWQLKLFWRAQKRHFLKGYI